MVDNFTVCFVITAITNGKKKRTVWAIPTTIEDRWYDLIVCIGSSIIYFRLHSENIVDILQIYLLVLLLPEACYLKSIFLHIHL